MRFVSEMASAFLAGVCLLALSEHVAPVLGSRWLHDILPFGLALQPPWLGGIFVVAALAAWLLLRGPKHE